MKTTNRLLLSLMIICLVGRAVADPPATSSPSARTDLICPTVNDADCYPRLFQPTEDFQIIKPDQDLPPGLHVRLNIWSGKREARLNVPMEGEEHKLDLPAVHDSAVVVVPQPEGDDNEEERTMRDRVPQKPPVYESAGKIQPPPPTGVDTTSFASAIAVLKSGDKTSYQEALDVLDELSHDIYFGLELTKSPDTINGLFTLMHTSDDHGQKKQAANILGHSIQNNPTALKELLASWEKTSIAQSIGEAMHYILKAHSHTEDPGVAKAKIYALNWMAKDHAVRDAWLKEGGMNILLHLFKMTPADKPEESKLLIKLVDFVVDTFLDKDMGAESGVWPERVPPQLVDACDETVERRGMNGRCWQRVLRDKLRIRAANVSSTTPPFERFKDMLDMVLALEGPKHVEL